MRIPLSVVASAMIAVAVAAPSVASADPVVNFPTARTFEIGSTGELTGTGCVDPGGQPTYVGQFLTTSFDTELGGPGTYKIWEAPADADGSWTWETSVDPDQPTGDFGITYECSNAPIETLSDPAVLWASAQYTVTVVQASASRTQSAVRTMSQLAAGVRPAAQQPGTASFSVDPDALPLVDHLGIPGPQAAALKYRVDAAAANVSQVVRLNRAYLGTYADPATLATYVNLLKAGATPAALSTKFDQTTAVKSELVPLSYQAMIDQVYMNLFGHKADATTNAFWTAQLRAKVTVPAMVLAIANSDDAHTATDNAAYVVAAELTLAKPITGLGATDALAAPLNSQHQTKVAIVENIALS